MAKNEKSAAAEKIAAAEKVKAKKPKSDKPNVFVRAWKAIVRFFKDLRGETKKIVWPDGKTVLKSTGVVLAVVVVFTIVIGLVDLGLSKSIGLLSDVARGSDETTTEVQLDDADAKDDAAQTPAVEEAEIPTTEEAKASEAKETETPAAEETEAPTAADTAADTVSE